MNEHKPTIKSQNFANDNSERQNLTMILMSIILILVSAIIIVYNKFVFIFWDESRAVLYDFVFVNSSSILVVILLCILLNNYYLSLKWSFIILLQLVISMIVTFFAFVHSLAWVELLRKSEVLHNLISDNLTLIILIITIMFQVAFTYLCFLYLTRSVYYVGRYFLNKKIYTDKKYATKEQIKKVHSTTQLERWNSIAVIIITIVWLNNDNIDVPDAFESLFDSNLWVMVISLSIYANYIVMFLLKKNTILDEVKK